jgi:hypothetical protein
MAGSYNHCITRNGNLMSNDRMMITGAMIENLGDAYEAIEEMFGMIWFLAGDIQDSENVPEEALPSMIKDRVEAARQNYSAGLELSKVIHRVSPDQRRD